MGNQARLIRKSFPFLALALLLPWPVAYGYEASGAPAAREPVEITVAEASAAPCMTVFGQAISGVKPGDLFYIDASNQPADFRATLYITNADELVHSYRYLTLNVGIYARDGSGGWEKALRKDGGAIADNFITLQNGHVRFELAGCASYKLTLDSGSVYCMTTGARGGSVSPRFYLEAE